MIKINRSAVKIPQTHILPLLVAVGFILLFSLAVCAQDNLVVPGKRVGSVRLGDTRTATLKHLGQPNETTLWFPGRPMDLWLGPEPPKESEADRVVLKVFYRAGRVVQIEFNDPKYRTAAGVSIASTLAEFRAQHNRPRVRAYAYDDHEGSGFVGYYYDDVNGGIAFSFRTQDSFDATTKPENLRVHVIGQPVIPDLGGKPTKAPDERAVEKQQSPSARPPARQNNEEIEKVIRTFWVDLGRLDGEGLKGLLGWPMLIVEAAEKGNKQSVLRNSQEFDEAFKHTPEAALQSGKSEFFGTRVSGFNVQLLNDNLASVSYICQLPNDVVEANPAGRREQFKALTVLQRDPDRGNKWKIVFVTVPK